VFGEESVLPCGWNRERERERERETIEVLVSEWK